MEVFEFRLDNENVLCTFYKKSKLSKEAHGFKFGGQRVEDILKALGAYSLKKFFTEKMLKILNKITGIALILSAIYIIVRVLFFPIEI